MTGIPGNPWAALEGQRVVARGHVALQSDGLGFSFEMIGARRRGTNWVQMGWGWSCTFDSELVSTGMSPAELWDEHAILLDQANFLMDRTCRLEGDPTSYGPGYRTMPIPLLPGYPWEESSRSEQALRDRDEQFLAELRANQLGSLARDRTDPSTIAITPGVGSLAAKLLREEVRDIEHDCLESLDYAIPNWRENLDGKQMALRLLDGSSSLVDAFREQILEQFPDSSDRWVRYLLDRICSEGPGPSAISRSGLSTFESLFPRCFRWLTICSGEGSNVGFCEAWGLIEIGEPASVDERGIVYHVRDPEVDRVAFRNSLGQREKSLAVIARWEPPVSSVDLLKRLTRVLVSSTIENPEWNHRILVDLPFGEEDLVPPGIQAVIGDSVEEWVDAFQALVQCRPWYPLDIVASRLWETETSFKHLSNETVEEFLVRAADVLVAEEDAVPVRPEQLDIIREAYMILLRGELPGLD